MRPFRHRYWAWRPVTCDTMLPSYHPCCWAWRPVTCAAWLGLGLGLGLGLAPRNVRGLGLCYLPNPTPNSNPEPRTPTPNQVRGLVYAISGPEDMSLHEVDAVARRMAAVVHPNAQL